MTHCRVNLLDESIIELTVNLHHNGQDLLDKVFKHLNLIEKDYFGLKYKGVTYDNVWLRPDKQIKKQFPGHPEKWEFSFAVRFYPTDPSYLKEEITKYQLCLQIRDDLMCGRLHCPLDTLAILSSYWLQSEFGDGEEESAEVKRYLSSPKYISGSNKPAPEFEERVQKLYKSRRGMPVEDADTQLLRLASSLPLYGVHCYVTEGKDGEEVTVGVGSAGIFEVKGKEKLLRIKWGTIKNINYKKERFQVKLLPPNPGKPSEKKVYKLPSALQAHAMWKDAVDQHIFFRVTGSDITSQGRTPINSPYPKREKQSAKKRKLSFRLGFRKKRPKTEAQVREQSAQIKRPNPKVVRQSSLKRSASLNFEHHSDSWDSAQSEARGEKSATTAPLKPILKKTPVSKEEKNAESPEGLFIEEEEEEEDEDGGRPFTNEDFLLDPKDEAIQQSSPLLLTQTILEEEEDTDAEMKTPEIKLVGSERSMDAENTIDGTRTPPNSANITPENEPVTIRVEEHKETTVVCPVVTVDVCPEPDPRKLSVVETNFLSKPPLISQSTREAILYYSAKEGKNAEGQVEEKVPEKQSQVEEVFKKEQEERDKTGQRVSSSENTDVSNGFSSESEDYQNEERSNADDDERKTVGACSSVAVLGDDDITIRDLVDDVTIGDLSEYAKGRSETEEDDSKTSPSTGSSISDITDDTEELCRPNILEIIWSKCSGSHRYNYREIFGVKLRMIRGRYHFHRHKSTLFGDEFQLSTGTQVPTPPPANGVVDSNSLGSKKEFFPKKRFVPSWPFDPDSLALNTELDELDREAIKAALLAQKELEVDMEDTLTFEEKSDLMQWKNIDETKRDTSEKKSGSDVEDIQDDGTDSIPGIPEFHQSVLKSYNGDSDASSRRASMESVGSHRDTVLIVEEKLIFPPTIQTYQSGSVGKADTCLLVYKPDTPLVEHPPTSLKTESTHHDGKQEAETQENELLLQRADNKETSSPEGRHQALKQSLQRLEDSDSGRSTPSSFITTSSFPRFVQSVFPFRKMSAAAESDKPVVGESADQIVMSQPDANELEEKDNQTSSTSLSECSVRSVRGSTASDDSADCQMEAFFAVSPSSSSPQTTRVTVIDFINENHYEEESETEPPQRSPKNLSSDQQKQQQEKLPFVNHSRRLFTETYDEEIIVEGESLTTQSDDTLPYDEETHYLPSFHPQPYQSVVDPQKGLTPSSTSSIFDESTSFPEEEEGNYLDNPETAANLGLLDNDLAIDLSNVIQESVHETTTEIVTETITSCVSSLPHDGFAPLTPSVEKKEVRIEIYAVCEPVQRIYGVPSHVPVEHQADQAKTAIPSPSTSDVTGRGQAMHSDDDTDDKRYEIPLHLQMQSSGQISSMQPAMETAEDEYNFRSNVEKQQDDDRRPSAC